MPPGLQASDFVGGAHSLLGKAVCLDLEGGLWANGRTETDGRWWCPYTE